MNDFIKEQQGTSLRFNAEALRSGGEMLQRLRSVQTTMGEMQQQFLEAAASDERIGEPHSENSVIARSIGDYIDSVNNWRTEVMQKGKEQFKADGQIYPDVFQRIPIDSRLSREIFIGGGDRPEHLIDLLVQLGIITKKDYADTYFDTKEGQRLLEGIQKMKKGQGSVPPVIFQSLDKIVWFSTRISPMGDMGHYVSIDVTQDINTHGDIVIKQRNAICYAQAMGVGVYRTADELITVEGLLSRQQRPLVLDN